MRFDIRVNGEHLCYAGLSKSGMLTVSVDARHVEASDPESVRKQFSDRGDENTARIHVNGAYGYGGKMNDIRRIEWVSQPATVGDEIVVRLVPDGEVSQPISDGAIEDLQFSPLISWRTVKNIYRLLFVHYVSVGRALPAKRPSWAVGLFSFASC